MSPSFCRTRAHYFCLLRWAVAVAVLHGCVLTGFSQAPTITARPLTRLISVGQSATFSVAVSDPAAIAYQWRRNGSAITGASGASYTLPSATLADRGYYEVAVSNPAGTATSVFNVHVAAAPTSGTMVIPWGAEPAGAGTVINPPVGLSDVVSVAAGNFHAVALKADGTVVAWGSSTYGATSVPSGLRDVVAVSASAYQSLALKADGTVVSWGNYFSSSLPVPADLQRVVAISSRGGHLALKSDGTVVAWGTAAAPTGLIGVRAIAAGTVHNLALRVDGLVVGWGSGSSDNPQIVPSGLTNVVMIGAGDYHSLALKADGTVVAWGRNDVGQATVPGGLDQVIAIAGGFVHSIALRADGTVIGWGRDNEGQVSGATRLGAITGISAGSYYNLGLATAAAPSFSEHPASRTANIGDPVVLTVKTTGAPVPALQWRKNGVDISGATGLALTIANAQSVVAGNYTVRATNSLGTVLSNAATVTMVQPLVVSSRSLSKNVSVGQPVSFSITANGAISYQWKRNGQIIAGANANTFAITAATLSDRGYYEVIATDANGGTGRGISYLNVSSTPNSLVTWGYGTAQIEYPPGDLTDVIAISGGGGYHAALRTNGTVTVWGNFAPTVPPGITGVVALAAGGNHLLLLKSDGTVLVVGSGGYSEQAVPAGATNIVAVSACGYNSLALRADGAVFRWGYDYYGDASVPPGLINVVAIAAGRQHSVALKSDGNVVAWGHNDHGPTTVSPLLNGTIAIAAGGEHSMALRHDGTVTVWGDVGPPPLTLGTAHAIAAGDGHALALRSDGTVVAWGRNDFAQSTVPPGLNSVNAIAPGLALLAVPAVPAIISGQPASRTAAYDQTATFSVVASGTPLLSYQWYKNGNILYDVGSVSGTRSSSLSISNAQFTDAGSYTVNVRNGYASVTSSAATLNVIASSVTAQSATIVGGSVTLNVSGPAALSYQWRFRGTSIAGATNASLTLDALSRAHNGAYDVMLTHADGPTVSHAYTLDVRPAVMPNLFQADPTFAPRFEQEGAGAIFAVLRLPDGKFLVGGDFTRLGATPSLYLARLHANGAVDPTFVAPVVSGNVHAMLMQADGKICVAGDFAFVNGVRSGGLVRLNADLAVDSTFTVGQGFDGAVYALAQQSDGRLLVGGEFLRYGADYANRILRLNADGTRESGFGFINTLHPVRVIRIGQDGKAVIGGGGFSDGSMGTSGFIYRLLSTGMVDGSWHLNGFSSFGPNAPVLALQQMPDERWIMAGAFSAGNYGGSRVARLTKDGAPDTSFVLDPALQNARNIRFVADAGAGRLLIAGDDLPLSRVTSGGARDSSLPALPFTNGDIRSASVESDGAIRIWGAFTGATRLAGSVTLAANGASFGAVQGETPRGLSAIFDAQPVTGNRFLVRGGFTHVNDTPRRGLVRLNADGTVESAFNPGVTLSTADTGRFAVQGDGRILVHTGTALARLLADGALDSSYAQVNYTPGTVIVDRDGGALVANGGTGGVFASTMGVRRVTPGGALTPDFSVSVTGIVNDMAVQAGGRILIGGGFGSINGSSWSGLARVFTNGTHDPSYPTSGFGASRLYPAGDDRTYVLASRVYRLDAAGVDPGFDYGSFVHPAPLAILPLPDGKLLRASLPDTDSLGNASWLLGRHLNNGTLDSVFQTNGLDRLRTRIERMLLTDDGSVWIFGRDLTVFGAPRLGAVRLAAGMAVTVTSPPVNAQALSGGSATFSVTAAGTGPLLYQWYRNGMKISGATGSSLTLSNLSLADVAPYTVSVTNPFGTVTSPPAALTGPNPAPTITSQPVSQAGIVGNPVTLSVSATAAGSLTYQWRRYGYAMPGATNASFTIPHASRLDAGLYEVAVADGLSVTTSQGVRLTVAPSTFPNTLQIDPAFAPRFEAAGGSVNAILPAAGGKFIVTGDFTRLNGTECPGIARLDANLLVDSTFTPPMFLADQTNSFAAIGIARAHAVLDDGRILVTHPLPSIGEYPFRNRLVRLLPNGSVDPTFNASTEPQNITRLAVQPDGRVIVMGIQISVPLPAGKRYVYRLNTDGSLDSTYAPVFTSSSSSSPPTMVAVQSDGRAIFGGGFDGVNGTAASGLVRLTPTGALDQTFSLQGISSAAPESMAVLADGRLLVGGSFTIPNQISPNLIRLSVNGALETVLMQVSGANAPVRRLAQQSDGKLWAISGYPNTSYQFATVWRFNAAGVIEQQSTAHMYGLEWAIAPAGADRLLIASKPELARAIVRLGADGNADGTSATIETSAGVNAAISAPAGMIYAAGPFTRVNGVPQNGLVRLTSGGALDATFDVGTGFNTPPEFLLLLGDRQLLASGSFSTFRGSPVARTVRLQSNGLRDTSFAPEPLGNVTSYGRMTQLLDGRIVIGGGACLRADGTVDSAFQIAGSTVPDIALPDGGLLIGTDNSSGRRVVRLRGDGTSSGFANVNVGRLSSIALQPDEKILAGGANFFLGGQPMQMVRLNSNLTADSFSLTGLPLPAFTTSAYRGPQLSVQEDGRIILNDYYRFGRLQANGAFDPSFALSGVSVLQTDFTAARSARGMIMLNDGSMLLADETFTANGLRRQGILRLVDPGAAVITAQPTGQTAIQGGGVTLSIGVVSPDAPSYQWLKNGQPVGGATSATLNLLNLSGIDAGSYSVNVTNANGTVRSAAANLAIQSASPPVIAAHPKARYVAAGQSVSFVVVASGTAPLAYRWFKDGGVLAGATQSSFTIATVSAGDAANYSAEVSNVAGTVVSNSARLALLPSGMVATHERNGPPAAPGGTVTIANTFTSSSATNGLKWQVLLPAGWSIASTSGNLGEVVPVAGTTDLAEWNWSTPPPSPLAFSYVLNVPTSIIGPPELAALVTVPSGDGLVQLLATPDPLVMTQHHSADTNYDLRISLLELTRVIELYNTRIGTTRSGSYTIGSGATEDGFTPDPTRPATGVAVLSRYHSGDSNLDGRISLLELTRVIEFYNYRNGTVRTGQYHVQAGTEDGFAPGP
jgi:uncharacterized delta-60 repeat protein